MRSRRGDRMRHNHSKLEAIDGPVGPFEEGPVVVEVNSATNGEDEVTFTWGIVRRNPERRAK